MSKIAIFLCAVFCASTVNSYNFTEEYARTQSDLETYIDDEIARINNHLKGPELKDIDIKVGGYCPTAQTNLIAKIQSVIQQDKAEVDRLSKGECVNLKYCMDIFNQYLISLQEVAQINVTQCIANNFFTDIRLSMLSVANNSIHNLTAMKQEARTFGNGNDFNQDQIKIFNSLKFSLLENSPSLLRFSPFQALIRINWLGAQAYYIAKNTNDFWSAGIGVLTDRLGTIENTIDGCVNETDANFRTMSTSLVAWTRRCLTSGKN